MNEGDFDFTGSKKAKDIETIENLNSDAEKKLEAEQRLAENSIALPVDTKIYYTDGRIEDMSKYDDGEKMSYDTNNGVAVYIDDEGERHVIPVTKENIKTLDDVGYHRGGLGVPLSNGDQIFQQSKRIKWEKLMNEAYRINSEKHTQEKLTEYQEKAQENGVDVDIEISGKWMMMDDMETMFPGTDRRRSILNNINDFISRSGDAGTYGMNNGAIAFIDHKGVLRVGPAISENLESLQKAGYKEGGMFVPLSNGELPVRNIEKQEWLDMYNRRRE